MSNYYIDLDGLKDGPHDLVTIMRRIRAGKILKDTLIYAEAQTLPVPAYAIPDIALFFESDKSATQAMSPTLTPGALIGYGWNFVQDHGLLTVFSGVIMLLSLFIAYVCNDIFDPLKSAVLAWMVFVLLHNFYLVFALRSYREQAHGGEFIRKRVLPISFTLFVLSIFVALMIAGGLLILVIPGVYVAISYIFTPFLIYDRKYGVIEAMYASRILVQKHGKQYVPLIACLLFMHLLCLILIVPIPITLPIYAAALSRLYEELLAL